MNRSSNEILASITRPHGLGQKTLVGPTSPKATKESAGIHAHFLCPSRNTLDLALEGNVVVAPSISELLFSCRPTAVLRIVIAMIFDSIQRMLWRRSWPQVGVEILEGRPPLANLDTATAIMGIIRHLWIVTTPLHSVPSCILWCIVKPMGRAGLSDKLRLQTSTRTSAACTETAPKNDCLPSALTGAKPQSRAIPIFPCPTDHHQPAIHIARLVNQLAHRRLQYKSRLGEKPVPVAEARVLHQRRRFVNEDQAHSTSAPPSYHGLLTLSSPEGFTHPGVTVIAQMVQD